MISKLRNAIFWAHLAIGITAGLFILNMAVSGILIAYEKQITAFAEQAQRTVSVPPGASSLDMETLAAKVQEARPNAAFTGVVFFSDPNAAVMFNVGRDNKVVFANPYTGAVIGDGQKTVRAFFRFMTGWHRWFAMEGSARPVGQAITGVVSLAYFALLCGGLCLWLPRQWSRNGIKQAVTLNWRLRGRARDWNWHAVIGFWSSPLLLLVTLTGIIMSYNWAGDLLFRVTGNPAPEHRREGARTGDGPASKPNLDGIDPLCAEAGQKVVGWKSISLRFSPSPNAPATFTIDCGTSGRPDEMAQLSLDRDTGEVIRWQPYENQNAGQKLRSWVRPIHTGQAGGFLGQSIAVLTALGGGILVYTGLSMAWRRFFGGVRFPSDSLSQPQTNPSPL